MATLNNVPARCTKKGRLYIKGVVYVNSRKRSHNGLSLTVDGTVKLQFVEKKRSFLSKDLQKEVEFIVEYSERTKTDEPNPVDFSITPQSLANVKDRQSIPDFLIRGHLDSDKCCITKPFTGTVVVERANAPIRSIDIQLVRVETCGCAEGYSKDATEIQNIQISEGGICHGMAIPLYIHDLPSAVHLSDLVDKQLQGGV